MASFDVALDDMVNNRRRISIRGGRGQGRPLRGRGQGWSSRGGRPFGVPHRNTLGVNTRPSSYTIAKSFRRTKSLPWQNGLFEDSLKAAGMSGVETGTKLYISNLDAGVTNDDIRELFSEMGELVRYAIHYDRNGHPSGSSEVVFARRSDAFQALKRYNNVQLDGKPMKIEIIGSNAETPLAARVNVAGGVNGRNRTVVMRSGPNSSRGGFTAINRGFGQRSRGGSYNGIVRNSNNGGIRGANNGGIRGGNNGNVRGHGLGSGQGRGRGRGRVVWRKKNVEKSADDLDKELESYHSEAMQS